LPTRISVFLTLSGFIYLDIFDETLCSILFVSLHTPSIVGIVSTATIAIFRFRTSSDYCVTRYLYIPT
jgi:hypothetical protein